MHKRESLVKDMALRHDLMKEQQHFITSIKVINGGYDEQNTCSWSQNLLEMVGLLDEMLYYALYIFLCKQMLGNYISELELELQLRHLFCCHLQAELWRYKSNLKAAVSC